MKIQNQSILFLSLLGTFLLSLAGTWAFLIFLLLFASPKLLQHFRQIHSQQQDFYLGSFLQYLNSINSCYIVYSLLMSLMSKPKWDSLNTTLVSFMLSPVCPNVFHCAWITENKRASLSFSID